MHLRFTPWAAPAVRDGQGPAGRTLYPLAGGGLDLILHAPFLEDLVPWILGFGDQVEVLRPERLRHAVRDRAEQIARFHARAQDPFAVPSPSRHPLTAIRSPRVPGPNRRAKA